MIGDDVSLGQGNTIGAFAVLTGPLSLGDHNWIGAGAVLGAPPEVRTLVDPDNGTLSPQVGLIIGSNNVIREYAQIHQGWKTPTRIGNNCYLMNQVYIAHDCDVHDNVTMASSALLAGHVAVGDSANLGLGSAVHQGLTIGGGVMLGMGSISVKSIPMFMKAYGNPARIRGVNVVGMERLGLSPDAISLMEEFSKNPSDENTLERLKGFPELDRFRTN